ncbi:hypothetical protein [Photobacterium leiognathi]|uniref:hypothetical protein n=1 Tax=Photobacterium leiognathi TaxID=553611 RepID=UPI00076A0296|nr:hypothetical protein [Photobacterium leiognathi]
MNDCIKNIDKYQTKVSIDFFTAWKEGVKTSKIKAVSSMSSSLASTLQAMSNSSDTNVVQETSLEAKVSQKYNQAIKFLFSDEFIEGEISKTHLYLENLYQEDPEVLRAVVQKAWLSFFKTNQVQLLKLINICSGLDYHMLAEHGDVMIIGACSNRCDYVKEAAIRCAEAWEQKEHIDYLKNIEPFRSSWLEAYRAEVIEYLESL